MIRSNPASDKFVKLRLISMHLNNIEQTIDYVLIDYIDKRWVLLVCEIISIHLNGNKTIN